MYSLDSNRYQPIHGLYGYTGQEDAEPKPDPRRCKCDTCYKQFTSHGPACLCLGCIRRDTGQRLAATPCWHCGTNEGGGRWFFDQQTGTLKCAKCGSSCKEDAPSAEWGHISTAGGS